MPDVKPIHAVDNVAADAIMHRPRRSDQTPPPARGPAPSQLRETASAGRLEAARRNARATTRNIVAERERARATERRLADGEEVAERARRIAEKGAADERRPGPTERGRMQRDLARQAEELQHLSGGDSYGLTRAGVATRSRAATSASIARIAVQRVTAMRAEAQTRVRRLRLDERLSRRTEDGLEAQALRAQQARAREELMGFSSARLKRDAAQGLLAATTST